MLQELLEDLLVVHFSLEPCLVPAHHERVDASKQAQSDIFNCAMSAEYVLPYHVLSHHLWCLLLGSLVLDDGLPQVFDVLLENRA